MKQQRIQPWQYQNDVDATIVLIEEKLEPKSKLNEEKMALKKQNKQKSLSNTCSRIFSAKKRSSFIQRNVQRYPNYYNNTYYQSSNLNKEKIQNERKIVSANSWFNMKYSSCNLKTTELKYIDNEQTQQQTHFRRNLTMNQLLAQYKTKQQIYYKNQGQKLKEQTFSRLLSDLNQRQNINGVKKGSKTKFNPSRTYYTQKKPIYESVPKLQINNRPQSCKSRNQIINNDRKVLCIVLGQGVFQTKRGLNFATKTEGKMKGSTVYKIKGTAFKS